MRSNTVSRLSVIGLLSLIFYAFISMTPGLSQSLLYILFPLATLTSYAGAKTKKLNKYTRLLVFIVAWMCFCSIFSVDLSVSITQLKRVMCVLMACISVYYILQHDRLVPYVFLIWIVLYLVCLNYAKTHILVEGYDYETDRATDEYLNANLLAYYTFFITSIVFILKDEVENKWLKALFAITFLAMYPLSFYVAIITASRQVLIVQIPLLIILTYIRYVKDTKNRKWLILLLITIGIAIYYYTDSVLDIYSNSLLAKRAEATADDGRFKLLQDAWQVGWQNPLVGVGPDCLKLVRNDTFAHNTFLELFADTGLLGVCVYVYMLIIFLKEQYFRYRYTRNITFIVILTIGIIFIVDNMFYVYYLTSWLMSFFILISSYSDYYFNKIQNSQQHV